MIATTRGLVVLAALALALVLALLLVGPRAASRVDRTLVPGFDAHAVTAIALTRPSQPALHLEKSGDTWSWSSDGATAEPATIDALLAALRGATWHRRAPRSAAGEARGELRTMGGPGAAVSVTIGQELAGSEQTWLVIDDHALLVDSWVARALHPEPITLRLRQPLAGALLATSIDAGPVRIDGDRLVQPSPPGPLWLDPARRDALVRALASLEIVALPPTSPPSATTDHRITYDGPRAGLVARLGSCGDHVLVKTHAGAGCVEASAWQRVVDALAALQAPVEQLVDARPLPFTPTELAVFGTPVVVGPQPRVGDFDGDPDRIAELLAALSAPAEVVPRPAGKAEWRITARDAAGTNVTLDLVGKSIVRDGEPVALRPNADAWATITRPGFMLRDPVHWREDVTTLSSIKVDNVTYTRGAVLGEWTRSPAGPIDAALVDAFASALAAVRAPYTTAPSGRLPVRISVTFTPPAGQPTTHHLAIGTPSAGSCPARVDDMNVRVDLALCTAAHAL